jgi:hypothetical protein
MLKLTVVVLAVALAGTANAAGWRSLRIDASSEASFDESVAALQEKLPRVRRAVFERSLQDIWVERTRAAAADQREYTAGDYRRLLDGLSYKDVITFTDPTGETAERYWDQAYARLNSTRTARPAGVAAPAPNWNSGVATYSGSHTLDAGQSARANGRIGGTHH